MDTSGSVLKTFTKRVRLLGDEPSDDAIYKDSDLINHFFGPALSDVWARLNMASRGKVMIRHALSIVQGQEYYDLPPNIGRIKRMGRIDSDGTPFDEVVPRGEFHPGGVGWSVQGNTLQISPTPIGSGTVYIWYVPTGSVNCHYATDGGLYATDTTNCTFTLSTSPALGQLDRRPNAYAGQVLRILGSTVHQERVIESHDITNGRVTVRRPFNPAPGTSLVTYEIAPIASESLIQALAIRGAMLMLAMKRASDTQRQHLNQELRAAMKTVLDDAINVQARTGTAFERATSDNLDLINSLPLW